MAHKNNDGVNFPERLLAPIRRFLEEELKRLSKTKNSIKNADPFQDEARSSENSLEEDVDEQIGHFDAEVKDKLLARQIVQFRKALTRLKIGKYGVCENCGKMIDTDRLAAQPQTTLCMKCVKEKEL